jgi:hypothetical protein
MYAYMHAWASGAIIHTYTYMCTDTCMQMHTLTWQQEPPKPRHVLDSEALEGFLQRQKMYGEHNLAKEEESGMVWYTMCVYLHLVCMCMRVCMLACMYVCIQYVRVFTSRVCLYICMYVCIYVCMYSCMHVCINACMYGMHACIHVCVHVYMYVSVYA